ncbi:MAG: GNAT family N-acetyltransferase, partial [Lachnospiraceae bacterium]|nr:GNAT family N-acetyltransferase [Lachnospiraceae bacterium]
MKEGKREDLSLLHSISCQTYRDTFERYNTETNMRDYLEQAYNLEKLSNELSNSNSTFYFIYVKEDLAGYLKLNEFEAQINTD